MKTIREEAIGKSTVRLLKTDDGYMGIVLGPKYRSEPVVGGEPEALWQRLLRDVGKVHPDYFGFDGARSRFLTGFPGGFSDPAYVAKERTYKLDAVSKAGEALPEERAMHGDADALAMALRVFQATNLVSPFEKARIRDVLKHPAGADYLRAAANFAAGDLKVGLDGMLTAIRKAGQPPSWPLLTYLPFLWRPVRHLFLKPEVTKDFATRVGHPFVREYELGLVSEVYLSLLDLGETTRREIAELKPADLIDVQSFIWVVGAYSEDDLRDARTGC